MIIEKTSAYSNWITVKETSIVFIATPSYSLSQQRQVIIYRKTLKVSTKYVYSTFIIFQVCLYSSYVLIVWFFFYLTKINIFFVTKLIFELFNIVVNNQQYLSCKVLPLVWKLIQGNQFTCIDSNQFETEVWVQNIKLVSSWLISNNCLSPYIIYT